MSEQRFPKYATFYDFKFGEDSRPDQVAATLVAAEGWAQSFLDEYDAGNIEATSDIHRSEVAEICAALFYRAIRACRCTMGFTCTPCAERNERYGEVAREFGEIMAREAFFAGHARPVPEGETEAAFQRWWAARPMKKEPVPALGDYFLDHDESV